MQDFVQAPFELQFLFDDGHEHVDTDRDPHLSLHGVVGRAVESLDPQMLFDPLEEQLDLPAALVESRDRERRQREVVGQEHEPSFALHVVERDPPQRFGVEPRRLGAGQHDRLIAPQAGRLVDRPTRASRAVEVPLAARHEERGTGCKAMQAFEIDIASIHHVEGARFDRQFVEHGHSVHFPVGNMHKTRNVAAEVQERMQLDGSLAAAKLGPGEQAQAPVDRRGVERVDRLLKIDGQRFLFVQLPRPANQHLREIGIDSPIVGAIRIGQRAARNLATKTRVIQLRSQSAKAGLDVPQAFSKGKLREPQAQKLIATRKASLPMIASILADTSVELAPR